MNTTTFPAIWPQVRMKLKKKYAQLTDGDLNFITGREEEMVGRIQAKTGATRADLESYFSESEASFSIHT